MPEHIKLQFRPSLIIFVDRAGENIYTHFSPATLLGSLDAPLRTGIGLLRVKAGQDPQPLSPGASTEEESDPAQWVDEDKEEEEDDALEPPTEEDKLASAIEDMLRTVQLSTTIETIEDEGYAVPNSRTQIYIVGHADSESLATVLRMVREVLRSKDFDSLVCYMLSDYPAGRIRAINRDATLAHKNTNDTTWLLNDSSPWANREVANFCYRYGDSIMLDRPRFVKAEDAHYAMAAAIFALAATGITAADTFQREMELRPLTKEYDRIGTLSTSFIIFPRTEISAYCSAQLGADLISQWIADIDAGALPDEERAARQREAQTAIEKIEQWLKDDPPRPGTDNNKWPSLSILRLRGYAQSNRVELEQRRLYNQLQDQTRSLFQLFSYEEITNDETVTDARGRKKKRKDWTKIADKRADKAVEVFANWDRAATAAWVAAGEKICAELKQKVDQLWPIEPNGLDLAKVYIDEYYEKLNSLIDRMTLWREFHDRDYNNALQSFQELSTGDWVIDEEESNIIGNDQVAGAQATPTITGNGTNAATAASGVTIIGGPQAQASTHTHIPEHEDRIAQQLGQRIRYMQRQVTGPLSLVGLTVFFTTILLAAILSFLPGNLADNTLWVVAISLIIVAIVILVNWMAYRRRRRAVREAQEDLLNFYRRYYAHRCEEREDATRLLVTGPLHRRVLQIRERIDDMRSFISGVGKELEQETTRASNKLFNGPSASRDIFIANGERLQRAGKNTLKEFASQVAAQRRNNPRELWHRTLEEMKAELLRSLQRNPTSLVDMSDEETRQHIFSFTRGIITQYLTDKLVDIGAALDSSDTWRGAFDRARSPLYTAKVGMRDPQMYFICGRDQDIAKGQKFFPNEAITVQTKSTEWLLVATFFRGGSSTSINVDHLFPFKSEYLAQAQDSVDTAEEDEFLAEMKAAGIDTSPADDDSTLPADADTASAEDEDETKVPTQPLKSKTGGSNAPKDV